MDLKFALIKDSDSEEFFEIDELNYEDTFEEKNNQDISNNSQLDKPKKNKKKQSTISSEFYIEPSKPKPKIRVHIDPTLINNEKVINFIDYCIKKELVSQSLDNTCTSNILSCGLPDLYSAIADSFGNITEKSFISYFKSIGYHINLRFLYRKMLNRKKKLTWFKFYSFFYTILKN